MFLKQLKISILALAAFSVLTGVVYPFAVTAVAQFCLSRKANGSLIVENGKAVGSELIGQQFDEPKYFWGRLSATDYPYDASNSSGSNYGPLNPALNQAVSARIKALRDADPTNIKSIPVDLVTSSASGLDPQISPAAAVYQLPRVARARGLSDESVRDLVRQNTQKRLLGIWGEPTVNVLKLNLALDAAEKK